MLVPLSVFVLFSLRHPVKLDWTGGLWVALVPALAQAIAGGAADLPRWLRRSWGGAAVVVLLLYGATLHYLTLGLPGIPYSGQLQALPVAWSELGAQVERVRAQMPVTPGAADPLVVGMNRYMLASELAFYAARSGACGPQYRQPAPLRTEWADVRAVVPGDHSRRAARCCWSRWRPRSWMTHG